MPIITVVIPTYNRARLLEEAIISVLNQSWQDFTILVADNCSTDDTEKTVLSIKDKRITYVKHQRNIGLIKNWLFALTKPVTKYVALLNDDDLWRNGHLQNAIDILEVNPNANMYSCAVEEFGDSDVLRKPWWLNDVDRPKAIAPEESAIKWLRGTQVAPSAVVIRREKLQDRWYGPKDLIWSFDYAYFYQQAVSGVWLFNPVANVMYRRHLGMESHNWENSKFGAVQFRYAVRYIAEYGLECGLLNADNLFSEVSRWPLGYQATVIVALSSFDTNPLLRYVVRRLFDSNPELGRSPQVSGHCRLAGRVGAWYLTWADVVDRLQVKWWPRA